MWVGGTAHGPHTADYVAPHQDRVPSAISDLVRFARRNDIPVLVHAAIAHAQFETIHPFPDGNGRTGRAFIHSMLRAKGLARKVTVPVSAGLLADTRAYFDTFTRYREGEIAPIVETMANAAFKASTTAAGSSTSCAASVRAGTTRARRAATRQPGSSPTC